MNSRGAHIAFYSYLATLHLVIVLHSYIYFKLNVLRSLNVCLQKSSGRGETERPTNINSEAKVRFSALAQLCSRSRSDSSDFTECVANLFHFVFVSGDRVLNSVSEEPRGRPYLYCRSAGSVRVREIPPSPTSGRCGHAGAAWRGAARRARAESLTRRVSPPAGRWGAVRRGACNSTARSSLAGSDR